MSILHDLLHARGLIDNVFIGLLCGIDDHDTITECVEKAIKILEKNIRVKNGSSSTTHR